MLAHRGSKTLGTCFPKVLYHFFFWKKKILFLWKKKIFRNLKEQEEEKEKRKKKEQEALAARLQCHMEQEALAARLQRHAARLQRHMYDDRHFVTFMTEWTTRIVSFALAVTRRLFVSLAILPRTTSFCEKIGLLFMKLLKMRFIDGALCPSVIL